MLRAGCLSDLHDGKAKPVDGRVPVALQDEHTVGDALIAFFGALDVLPSRFLPVEPAP